MVVNTQKLTLTTTLLNEYEEHWYETIFPFEPRPLDVGLKYLGFYLKPNGYKKNDWDWLIEKVEKRIKIWIH